MILVGDVGDVLQLPIVKNTRYGNLREYAFTSSFWPNHSVFLDKVVLQDPYKVHKKSFFRRSEI